MKRKRGWRCEREAIEIEMRERNDMQAEEAQHPSLSVTTIIEGKKERKK